MAVVGVTLLASNMNFLNKSMSTEAHDKLASFVRENVLALPPWQHNDKEQFARDLWTI